MLIREENSNILTKKREKEMVIMWVMKVLNLSFICGIISQYKSKITYHIVHLSLHNICQLYLNNAWGKKSEKEVWSLDI